MLSASPAGFWTWSVTTNLHVLAARPQSSGNATIYVALPTAANYPTSVPPTTPPKRHPSPLSTLCTFSHSSRFLAVNCPESLKALRATLDTQNVQWLFGQMREKLESPPPGVQIDEDYIKTLIVGVLPARSITQESLDKDARFIMNFVDETRYANIYGMMFQRTDTTASIGPFYELWMREEKIQKRSDKFASLGSSA